MRTEGGGWSPWRLPLRVPWLLTIMLSLRLGGMPGYPLAAACPPSARRGKKAGVTLGVGGGAGAGTLKRVTWSASGEWKR